MTIYSLKCMHLVKACIREKGRAGGNSPEHRRLPHCHHFIGCRKPFQNPFLQLSQRPEKEQHLRRESEHVIVPDGWKV